MRDFIILTVFPVISALTASLVACSDPLVERQDVNELRVIAARVEPLADPSRATLVPGERARVSWLVVGPEGRARVSHGLSVCSAAPALRGIPECAGAPIASDVTDAPELETTLDFEVPSGERLLMSGVFCTRGEVELDELPEDSRCLDENAQQELATYEVSLSSDPPNHHPDLTGLALSANGAPWPTTDELGVGGAAGAGTAENQGDEADPCVSTSALHVASGAKLTLDFTLPDSARERRPSSPVNVGAWETLQISQLSTRGHFERPFTVFDADAEDLTSRVEWRAPDSAGAAHLYLVVRDLRGGISVVTRAVCVND